MITSHYPEFNARPPGTAVATLRMLTIKNSLTLYWRIKYLATNEGGGLLQRKRVEIDIPVRFLIFLGFINPPPNEIKPHCNNIVSLALTIDLHLAKMM